MVKRIPLSFVQFRAMNNDANRDLATFAGNRRLRIMDRLPHRLEKER